MNIFKKLTQKKEIEGLDGLRFVAVMVVIISHLVEVASVSHSESISSIGREGVLLFFTISGFIITFITLKEKETSQTINIGNFYLKRILKIIPVLYVYLLFLLTINNSLGISKSNFLSSFFMYKNYLFNEYSSFTGHIWSLAIEEHFYLIFPLMCAYMNKKQLKASALTLFILSPIIRILTLKFFPSSRINIDIMTHCRLDAFSVGILASIYFKEISNLLTDYKYKNISLVLLSLFYFLLLPISRENPFFKGYWLLIGMSISIITSAMILILAVSLKEGWLYQILNSLPFRHLGIISYSLYMWQEFAIYYFKGSLFSIFLAYALGLISFIIIELPFDSLKRKLLRSRRE